MEFDKKMHHQQGICLGMFLIFVLQCFTHVLPPRSFHQALFVYRHLEVAETWPVTSSQAAVAADNLKLCNCMCSRWKPRSGISPPQPQHFMTQVTEWPALQQKNVHIISKIEFPNAIEGWRIVFCIQHLFIMWKLNYRNISRSDCIRLWRLVKMWAATRSCAEDMFLHDKNGHICSFADRAGQ